LAAAQVAGFRESGISGLGKEVVGQISPVMVAVRSNGLTFDSIVGYTTDGHSVILLVNQGYLNLLAQLANSRFAENVSRTERFRSALRERFTRDTKSSSRDEAIWEPAGVRAARMRSEGLLKRSQAASQEQPSAPQSKQIASFGHATISDLFKEP